MNKSVLIRVDGSSEIGLGHLVRCIALAEMLKNNFSISFNSIEIPEEFIKLIYSKGFSFMKVKSEEHFLSILSGEEIVVLDHYDLNTDYQKEIKKIGCKLVCIDDLHDKVFHADLIINHLPGANPQDYKAQEYTNFALGLEYALLRPPFLEYHKKDRKINFIRSVFICFGGSDIKNLTQEVLQTVTGLDEITEIKVVIGHAYKYTDLLEDIVLSDKRISLFRSLSDDKMLDLMNKCDLAIVPASGILYEVISTNTPVITGKYVENQKYFLEQFSRLPYVISAGDFEKNLLKSALKEFLLMNNIVPENFIDGKSPERIRNKFELLK